MKYAIYIIAIALFCVTYDNRCFSLNNRNFMKAKTLILVALFSFVSISEASGTTKKNTKCPSQKELNELTLLLTKYGNNPEGLQPLHYAILQKDTKAVNLLLKHGANPHVIDKNRSNCIGWAIKARSLTLVERFVRLGVNTECVYNKLSALDAAVYLSQPEIACFLAASDRVSKDQKNNALRSIVLGLGNLNTNIISFDQRKKIITILVKHGVDINIKFSGEKTVLDYAMVSKVDFMPDMIKFLKSIGAK